MSERARVRTAAHKSRGLKIPPPSVFFLHFCGSPLVPTPATAAARAAARWPALLSPHTLTAERHAAHAVHPRDEQRVLSLCAEVARSALSLRRRRRQAGGERSRSASLPAPRSVSICPSLDPTRLVDAKQVPGGRAVSAARLSVCLRQVQPPYIPRLDSTRLVDAKQSRCGVECRLCGGAS